VYVFRRHTVECIPTLHKIETGTVYYALITVSLHDDDDDDGNDFWNNFRMQSSYSVLYRYRFVYNTGYSDIEIVYLYLSAFLAQ